ncbi:MAG: 4Fe-4S binding protein [Rhodobacteraceae bacterium]|nr:4Fe-4S binding protein [Paracoccaceae bacterium]
MTVSDWDQLVAGSLCQISPAGTLIHPGLPLAWGVIVWVMMLLICGWGLSAPLGAGGARGLRPARFTGFLSLGRATKLRNVFANPWLLTALKILTTGLFLLVIWAGLAGTPLPDRNIATVLTWNLWWSGVIISVFFIGSAWCAVCPWDALASWLVRRRLWMRAAPGGSLDLRVPKALRNVWPALALFVALTWLELGAGITTSPYATAVLALFILMLAVAAMALFERKAFCRFACPVGRTIGFYAQLAPVELRPSDTDICAACTTLECYHGSADVDPCPTHQVMGRMTQNTFCTSCSNCVRSCPQQNVGWRLRAPSTEALEGARPHWDEAWFMIALLALTGFHGLTMMEFWEDIVRSVARLIGDNGQLLVSFTICMAAVMALPVALYSGAVWTINRLAGAKTVFREVFAKLAFTALPLAFAYHLAHNLSHLLREGLGTGSVFSNPLGTGSLPMSLTERHLRMLELPVAPAALAAIQALLMVFGFIIAVLVIRHRGAGLIAGEPAGQAKRLWALTPACCFAVLVTAYHLWLLMQPMVMRM